MQVRREAPLVRQLRTLLVGLVCIASLAALRGWIPVALGLMVTAGIGYLICNRIDDPDTDGPVESLLPEPVERLSRWFLVAAGTAAACLGIICAAIPHFPAGGRPWANDAAAIATLKNIAAMQMQFQQECRLDRDGDGVGEYGYLAELASGDVEHPALLSPAFAKARELADEVAVVRRSGFLFLMYLPGTDGEYSAEGSLVRSDADQSEGAWCCYAWPAAPTSGKRAFFIDQSGVLRWTRNRAHHYEGKHAMPRFDAAWPQAPAPDSTGDHSASPGRMRDGQYWSNS